MKDECKQTDLFPELLIETPVRFRSNYLVGLRALLSYPSKGLSCAEVGFNVSKVKTDE